MGDASACAERSALDITLIAALDEDGVIGVDGGMPWHIPGDLRWFKQHTLHKPILMGRKTCEAIGRALPSRRNLVLSRDPGFLAEGCERVSGVEEAFTAARADGAAELVVIGGAEIYALTLQYATCLRLTRIEARYRGDTWFPSIDWCRWQLAEEQTVPAGNGVPTHRFMTWRRAPA